MFLKAPKTEPSNPTCSVRPLCPHWRGSVRTPHSLWSEDSTQLASLWPVQHHSCPSVASSETRLELRLQQDHILAQNFLVLIPPSCVPSQESIFNRLYEQYSLSWTLLGLYLLSCCSCFYSAPHPLGWDGSPPKSQQGNGKYLYTTILWSSNLKGR